MRYTRRGPPILRAGFPQEEAVNTGSVDAAARYGVLSRFNHWVIALAIIGMLAFGLLIEDLAPKGPERTALIEIHKALGVLILAFGAWRVAWRLLRGFLPEASAMPAWQRTAARLVHWALLAGVILMPLSGLLSSVFAGRATDVFGLFAVPAGPRIGWLSDASYGAHEVIANLLIAAIALHVLGALKHHYIDRDTTLRRMIGRV